MVMFLQKEFVTLSDLGGKVRLLHKYLYIVFLAKHLNQAWIISDLSITVSKKSINMSTPKADLVKSIIDSDKVVIFSKTYCPYCKLAKEVFDKIQEKYTTVELDLRDDGDEIQSILADLTGARTVPRVFVKGNCLGGGSDVKSMLEKGELQKVVA